MPKFVLSWTCIALVWATIYLAWYYLEAASLP